jgi:hypothetical protein
MTARPIFPECRRRPMRAAVALVLVMVAVLLAAGCGGWNGGRYERDQDILITKMNPEGVIVWTKMIDTGKYDFAMDFTQTSDGGFVIVGGTTKMACLNYPQAPETPSLTRLSNTGEILWERDFSTQIMTVMQNADGSFSVISNRGIILQLDSNGTILDEQSPKIRQELNGEWVHFNTFTGMKDGGYLLAGQSIVKVDPEGNLSWQQSDNLTLKRAFSIAELNDAQGYLVLVFDDKGAEVLHLDQNGSIIRANVINTFDFHPKPDIHQTSDGYSLVLHAYNPPFMAYHFDRNGILKDNVTLNNVTIDMGNTVLPSDDGGFIDIANIEPGDLTKVTKLNPNGTISWTKTSKCSDKKCPTLYGDVMRTSDGGFAIMSAIEKQHTC